ncbi:MAG: hypothetical protein ACK4ND_11935 [Cytophagaceae bacterium]
MMEDENVFELEQPLAVRIKDDVFEDLFDRLNLNKREIYMATQIKLLEGSVEGKKFFKLLGVEEFIDEDYFLLMVNISPN